MLTTGLSASWAVDRTWLKRAQEIVCCPCSVLVDFVRSMFSDDAAVAARNQRGYARVATSESATRASAASFHEPGRVTRPPNFSESP